MQMPETPRVDLLSKSAFHCHLRAERRSHLPRSCTPLPDHRQVQPTAAGLPAESRATSFKMPDQPIQSSGSCEEEHKQEGGPLNLAILRSGDLAK
jgi:hypothetical protein